MSSRQTWTVFAVYDDNEQPYIAYVEAKNKTEARSKALRKADGVILIAGIAPGKISGADVDDLDNVVPIRGKHHEIDVTHVRISQRKFRIPGRCPACKKDLRRAGAMVEKFLVSRSWMGHLSHDGKHYAPERDLAERPSGQEGRFDLVMLVCTECKHIIWDGLHADV